MFVENSSNYCYPIIENFTERKKQSYVTPVKGEVNFYRPWRPLGLREVEVPTFSDIRLSDDGKGVSPTRRPLFTPRTIRGTHFC
jgi:hypothetical protein